MSALGFFRRRQRMVFWIMVILMVVFLITLNGPDAFFQMVQPNSQKFVIGQAGRAQRYDIRQADLIRAGSELDLLKTMGLGNPARVLVDPLLGDAPLELPGELGFLLLTDSSDRENAPARSWVLLRHEAEELGFKSNRLMAREAVEHMVGWNEAQVGQVVQQMRQSERMTGLQSADIYNAMESYLLVTQAFDASRGSLEPTEPELRQLYRDTNQRMQVAALSFAAKDYLTKVGEPTEEQVLELFNAARKEVPGDPANTHPFKFGYRQPDRVQIEYVFIDYNEILPSVQPDEEAMYQYWKTHQQEFTTATATASAPATQAAAAASKPATASQPAVALPYAQAKPEIRRRLQAQEAQSRLRQIADSVQERISTAGSAATAATQAASSFETVAKGLLKDGLPVVYRRSQPMSAQEMQDDPILGGAMRMPNGPTLMQAAFTVKELSASERAALAVGEVYQGVMDVSDGSRGKLVWRVSEALPSAVPDEKALADDAALRQRVRDDWRTMQGYQLALAAAKDAMEKAQKDGLEKTATALDKKVQTTESPLSRQVVVPTFTQSPALQGAVSSAFNMMRWLQGGRKGEQPQAYPDTVYVQAAKVNPYFIATDTSPLGEPWLPDQAQKFIDGVFALAPKDVTETPPATQPASQPAPAEALALVELPGEHLAVVAQRVKFFPAYESGYKERRVGLIHELREMRRHELAQRWYSQSDIQQRTNFQHSR